MSSPPPLAAQLPSSLQAHQPSTSLVVTSRHQPSLKEVLLGDATIQMMYTPSACTNDYKHDQQHNNNILVLDGGVSTHLKVKLGDGQDFAHRELWSSSLLLTKEGRELVKQGHLDWLQIGGVDVVSTVTYQCHYEQDLWPSVMQSRPNKAKEQENNVDASPAPGLVMDELWKHGLTLAQEAVASHLAAPAAAAPSSLRFNSNDCQEDNQQEQRRRRPAWVAASLGCFGAALANGAEYTGEYASYILSKVTTTTTTTPKAHATTTTTTLLEDYLVRFHQQKLQLALLHYPDAVAFETIPSLIECQAIAKLIQQMVETKVDATDAASACCEAEETTAAAAPYPDHHPAVAIWVSLACCNGDQLNDGTPIETALEAFDQVPRDRLQAIGFNCCHSQHLPKLVDRLLNHYYSKEAPSNRTRRGIVLYPNWGESWDATNSTWKLGSGCADNDEFVHVLWQCVEQIRNREKAEVLQQQLLLQEQPPPPLRPMSIILGGCCRTTPATIAALRRRVDEYYCDSKSTNSTTTT